MVDLRIKRLPKASVMLFAVVIQNNCLIKLVNVHGIESALLEEGCEVVPSKYQGISQGIDFRRRGVQV